uniref:DDE-1 domain-containing protein n=1 Tax=Spongospora subterranea TaxID=70186 RepID=A0A0H5RBX0_9EUKA|eukprot:CRZ11266.1 hypothetical protein [Spongospora subterranea]
MVAKYETSDSDESNQDIAIALNAERQRSRRRLTLHSGRKTSLNSPTQSTISDRITEIESKDLPIQPWDLMTVALAEDPALAGRSKKSLLKTIRNHIHVQHALVKRRATHTAQNTRYCAAIIDDFVAATNTAIANRRLFGMPNSNVINMDQTNMPFDNPYKTTYPRRGSRTVIRKTIGSSVRCSVALSVTFDGQKLPPMIVFKGVSSGRIAKEFRDPKFGYPQDGMVYAVQSSAWFDEATILQYIDCIVKPWIRNHGGSLSYLQLDHFKCHLMGSVRDAASAIGSQTILNTVAHIGFQL